MFFYLFILFLGVSSEKFKVCGNYCGPGWCNGMWLKENKCNYTIPVESHFLTGQSCPDTCCRINDTCCGTMLDTSECNKEIVKCLKKCGNYDMSCTYGYFPVPSFLIKDSCI